MFHQRPQTRASRPLHGLRASLLGRASLAAILVGCAAAPRAMAGGAHLSLPQALAAAAVARTTGNTASINAGKQAAIGIANLQAAITRFNALQRALAEQAHAAATQAAAIPNGIGTGGLQPETGYNQAGAGVWLGVSPTAPLTQTTAQGTTTVTINQTSQQAILNWSSFNVGSHTKLIFNQSAGGGAAGSWTVLNRIESPSTSPSQIFGAISAQGQVLVLNPNGVLFGDGAQVNLHSLVAGAVSLTDQQFLSTGIYGVYGSTRSPAVAAGSSVLVQAGATITTPAPANASDGGGSVILLAASVENDGTIQTPAGQTILGGGTIFTLRTGFSVPANSTVTPGTCPDESACSTVLGTEIDASGIGAATNKGFIAATTGDITLAGETVSQAGVLYSTNSVGRRGTIHLLTDKTDPKSSVTLASGSLTYIAPDPNSLTGILSQRNDTAQQAYGGTSGLLNDQADLPDHPDRSRIEITTGGVVNFADGSLTIANAGQVAVSAVAPAPAKGQTATQGQVFVAGGAEIDVSGLNNVVLPMSANTIQVNVQGILLNDAPVNRDTGALANLNLTLDTRQLIYVAPSLTDTTPRAYTAGGLLQVYGALTQVDHSIEEWSTYGGSVALQSDAVVAQPGSVVNIAGGTIQYQAGPIPQTYLIGPGGTLYNANTAPANLLYTGVYSGFTVDHTRWHITDTYTDPLLQPASIGQPAYIEGRDAGTLTLITPTVLFDGTLNAGVQTGPLQTVSHATVAAGTDPVSINQDVAPLAGALVLADIPYPDTSPQPSFPSTVSITPEADSSAATLTAGSKLSAGQIDTANFGAGQLGGLGALTIDVGSAGAKGANLGGIAITGALTLAPGGTLTLAAPVITIDAPVTVRSGAVTAETANPLPGAQLGTLTAYSTTQRGALSLGAGGSIDTQGEWTNLVTDPAATSGYAFVNGGNVSLLSSGALQLAKGSSIDASSGAVFTPTLTGGTGGNITLVADDPNLVGFTTATSKQAKDLAPVTLDGTLRSLGVTAGGIFSLAVPAIVIGNTAVPASGLEVALAPSFFASGFSGYVLNGFATAGTGPQSAAGVVVAPGTAIDVVEPILQATPSALLAPTGTDPHVPLSAVLFPEFILNPATQSFQRRAGASLTLDSEFGGPLPQQGSGITIGQNASITVDTGQSVTLQSQSQITVDGAIHAPGGTISVQNNGSSADVDPTAAARTSIWIGATATLDAAGHAVTGLTTQGNPVGEVIAGGSILIGASANINDIASFASADAYVFVRPGAQLDASGAAADLDLQAVAAVGVTAGQASVPRLTGVGSAGGTIAFASDFGIYLDGAMQAASGAANAAGGELAIRLGDPGYTSSTSLPVWAFTPHQIVVSQTTTPTPLPANLAPGDGAFAVVPGANGQAAISAQQVNQGGFGSLFLLARDQITFNGTVSLATAHSITLADYTTSATGTSGTVSLAAPYVLLAGAPAPNLGAAFESPYIGFASQLGSNQGEPFSKREPCSAGVAACYGTSLTVDAGLIDIEGDVRTNGAYANVFTGPSATKPLVVNSNGFNDVSLISSGDIRFVPAGYANAHVSGANGMTLLNDSLYAAGDITLDAARIYPATGVDAAVVAGFNYWLAADKHQGKLSQNALFYGSTLTIGSTSSAAQSAPLSVFGKLGLSAAMVVDSGDVMAPLGAIGFGNISGDFPRIFALGGTSAQAVSVTLAPGSVTSVSANGLTVPFGGTTDGTSYSYDASALTLPPASLGGVQENLPSIQFTAPQTTVAAGATLDISGGGTLTGGAGELQTGSGSSAALASQGFISGRGGATDTLVTPFITFNAKSLSASVPTLAQEPVYAIVPGYGSGYAPVTSLETTTTNANGVTTSYYGSLPQIGEHITIGAGVPGLAAGTYTLLPSYYALLPGAYRIQLGSATQVAGATPSISGTTLPLGNGTYQTTGSLGVSGTPIQNATPSAIYLTPGNVVRRYAQYDEEGYAAYGAANAALFGNPRPYLPQDAGALLVTLGQLSAGTSQSVLLPEREPGFAFSGTALAEAAPGGYSADLVVEPANSNGLDILAPGGVPSHGDVGVLASTIDAIGAGAVFLGNSFSTPTYSISTPANNGATLVTVSSGATLTAGAIFIIATDRITVDAGAAISTIGATANLPDSSTGVLFANNSIPNASGSQSAILAAANGNFDFPFAASGNATIKLGACGTGVTCGLPTQLLSGGFLGLLAGGATTIAPGVVFGARNLELDTSTLIIGTPPPGPAAPVGTALSQATLDQLIAGDPAAGIPALQSLQLIAGVSIDFFGNASLTTQNTDSGAASLGTLVITTPAIFGGASTMDPGATGTTQTLSGTTTVSLAAPETASITTGTLVWNSPSTASPGTAPAFVGSSITTTTASSGSAGPTVTTTTYSENTLSIGAQEIVIGYPAQAQAQNQTTLAHAILGFPQVGFTAAEGFTANNHASLSVYASASPSATGTAGTTPGYVGGDLTITAPVITTAPAGILGITAGGTLTLSGTPAAGAIAPGLGGEIDLSAAAIADSTKINLPSGKLVANATGSITLNSGAAIDLAGPVISITGQTRGSFGGTAELISQDGSITEQQGASIDISAADANAGTLSLTARAGSVNLLGSLGAGAPASFDAGSVDITASTFGGDAAFQSLATMLEKSGATYAQSFEQTGQGDLAVGNVTAQNVSISVDGGNLTVNGTIDASGALPGNINLAATGNLVLGATSILDASETQAHTDSFGHLILAENTPHIELQVNPNEKNPGTLTISAGATINMAGPQGLALGELEIDVARNKSNRDANIEATGTIDITGAAAINVNAFKAYTAHGTRVSETVPITADGTITQAGLDLIDAASKAFMDVAVRDGALHGPIAAQLSGLSSAYGGILNLRPGVEINSGLSGSLTVEGTLNLANFRYASINPNVAQPTGSVYGSGEPGVLWLRATDRLTIAGNITDGFAKPTPVTVQGQTLNLWDLSPMLAAGDLSWSLRLVAGADPAAADSRGTLAADMAGAVAATGGGNLLLSDRYVLPNNGNDLGLNVSVIRTGTGYIDLHSGGNFTETSPFGIYTAGTQVAAAPNAPGENFTQDGGNVTLEAGGTAEGYVAPILFKQQAFSYTNTVANWLRHSGHAWWVDFGRLGGDLLYAFEGLGTFGGGNVDITVGGNAGNIRQINPNLLYPSGGGLDITVASTGYTDPSTGLVAVLGGGDIRLDVGGVLNPAYDPNGAIGPGFGIPSGNLFGAIADLRGNVSVVAGAVGQIALLYEAIANDPRPVKPFVSETFDATGGPALILGDSQASISTRGDLVLGGVGDGGGLDFSFYQPTTAVRLLAAGGDLVPTTIFDGTNAVNTDLTNQPSTPTIPASGFYYYAPILDVVAGSGSVYLEDTRGDNGIQLAPSPDGALNILAQQSIYDGNVFNTSTNQQLRIEMSGAATLPPSELPGPLLPVKSLVVGTGKTAQKGATASGTLHQGDPQPTRFSAATGDIVGLQTGLIQSTPAGNAYVAATAVQIVAGNDVVSTGGITSLQGTSSTTGTTSQPSGGPDLFLANSATDTSLIQAGHDVIYANADAAGPGQLLVQAGGNVYQGDQGILLSVGEIGTALTPLTRESGAGITILAGLSGGYSPSVFADLYLNPANLADPATPLQDQNGKVERTYQDQLHTWLAARGYTGAASGALAYFLALPQYEQTEFVLTVYYAELNQSGLDYNTTQSRFYHSYLEGDEAIKALFPNTDLTGKAPANGGSLTLFSGETSSQGTFSLFDSAIRTEFGGAITSVVPYGQTLLGNYGIVPQATAGILTQGSGNINMYSYGSIILGQSRVLTTLGGNILIWMSSDGEINAGRGSKTTSLTPPPNISYDIYGNIFLSPTAPSSGAGIGALAPIAGIPAGDVNLVAPVGSINAGEAGVRASGTINVSALTLVNGANLSGAKVSGVPTITTASAAAVSAASSTAGQTQAATQQITRPQAAASSPSVIEVEVLVSGGESATAEKRRRRQEGL